MSNSYRDLIAWQKAFSLVTEVYRDTEAFPKSEMYGLTSQTRRESAIEDGCDLAARFCPRDRLHLARIQLLDPARDLLIPLFLCRFVHRVI
jgi:23S rRNA-intervening sequence protein